MESHIEEGQQLDILLPLWMSNKGTFAVLRLDVRCSGETFLSEYSLGLSGKSRFSAHFYQMIQMKLFQNGPEQF